MTVPDLERALYDDRSLVKHLAMRRTLFVFPRATMAFAQAGASDRVAASERRRLIRDVEAAGLHRDGERWLAAAGGQVRAVLSDGREATSSELRDEIPLLEGLDHLRGGAVLGRDGGGGPAGADHAVGRRADRAGVERRRVDHVSAPVDFHGVVAGGAGPVVPPRPTVWRGWSSSGCGCSAPARRPTSSGGSDRPSPRCARRWPTSTRWRSTSTGGPDTCSADDLEATEAVEPWAALLPPLDPTTMGWFDRDWYLGPHKAQLFDTSGNAGPTVWWDGRIVGGWRQRDSGEVVLQLLEDVGAEGDWRDRARGGAADRVVGWRQGPVAIPLAAVESCRGPGP